MGQAWNTLINYTEVSDVDYFQDLGASTLEANGQAHLLQLFSAGYQLDHWRMNVARVEYQTIAEDLERQYQQLPRIDLDGDYRFDDLDLLLTLNHQYTLFDHPDDTKVTGDRLRADYALAWDKRWMWGFLRPSAKLKHIGYTLDDPVVVDGDDNPAVTVPVADFDAGLYFERDTTWLFKGFTQTSNPGSTTSTPSSRIKPTSPISIPRTSPSAISNCFATIASPAGIASATPTS